MPLIETEKYNKLLITHLVEEFGIDKDKANEILNAIAQYILYVLAFKKSMRTPMGTLVFNNNGISISEQNTALIELLKSDFTEENLSQQLENLVAGIK